jgi:hypothetical protein
VAERQTGDRSGLDYLYKARKLGTNPPQSDAPASSSSSTTADFDAGLKAYAYMRVLDSIRNQTQAASSVRLSTVGDDVGMGAESLVPVAQRLQEAGLVEVVEPRWGDDSVALTDRGRALLEEGRDRDLVGLLGL